MLRGEGEVVAAGVRSWLWVVLGEVVVAGALSVAAVLFVAALSGRMLRRGWRAWRMLRRGVERGGF